MIVLVIAPGYRSRASLVCGGSDAQEYTSWNLIRKRPKLEWLRPTATQLS